MLDLEVIADFQEGEYDNLGSFNHSTLQFNVGYALRQLGDFTVATELSLDSSHLDKERFRVGNEVKPDVCIYPKRGLSKPYDILRMTEMPLLAIEILSPRQLIEDLFHKIE